MTFEEYQNLLNDYLTRTRDEYLDLSIKGDDFFDLDGRSYYRGKADMCLELVGFLFGTSFIFEVVKNKELSKDFVDTLKVLGTENRGVK